MATLQSPGVSVTVIDESIYAPSGSGTVPLIVTATRQNKLNEQGELASGTLPEMGDSLTLVTSRNDLVSRFGKPQFKVNNGTVIHGDETNEYGLHAAWRVLNQTNQAYILNANIDLEQLEPMINEPTQAVDSGTHWFDISRSNFGLFMWNSTTSAWEEAEVDIINSMESVQQVNGVAQPKDTIGVNGDFAAVTVQTPIVVYEKVGGTWIMLGAETGSSRDFQFAPHTRVPARRADGTSALEEGDLYIKTTVPRNGAFFDVSSYNADSGQFVTKEVPFYMANDDATRYFDGIGELDEGQVYAQIDNDSTLNPDYNYNAGTPKASDGVAAFTLKRFNGQSTTVSLSNKDVVDFDLSVQAAYNFIVNDVVITIDASMQNAASTDPNKVTVEEIVIALQGNPDLQAANIRTELAGKKIRFINTQGLDIVVKNGGDYPASDPNNVLPQLGFAKNAGAGQSAYHRTSNWEVLEYVASTTEPTAEAEINTLWYNTDLRAELLEAYFDTQDNEMKWRSYAWSEDVNEMLTAKLSIRSSAPESPSAGDIWLDSDDQENYPTLYKYVNNQWVLLDNTDQVTNMGVVFGNYHYDAPYDDEGNARPEGPSATVENVVPNAQEYPEGILFFNMDYSTNNVKEYQGNGEWVAVSGNRPDGSPYMGRKAQRQMVVRAMKRAVLNSSEIRARDKYFNLIAAPGYIELLPELNSLNVAKKQTAFVVGSSPMRLQANGNAVQNWATNQAGAFQDGEDGLVTFNNMSATWAFAGLQSDADGNLVSVPSDVMALDVLIQNDRIAYPWYAPAGDTRGLVPATSAIGYVEDGEFRVAQIDDGLVDTLYINNINPIINFPNEGIKVWGQKTLTSVSSSMDRINVSRLTAYLRYMLDRITRPFLFEQNDAQTRQAVVNVVEKFLADIVQKRGITDFVVRCDESNNTPARIDRNELWCDVAIIPTKSVEFIFIPVRLLNTGEL